jgi:hypothetical protein
MPKETTPTTSSHETKNRKLAYNIEFRNMLRENLGIIKTAIELADRAVAEYNPPEITVSGIRLKFNRVSGKWLQEQKMFAMRDGEIDINTYDESRWVPMNFGRAMVLVPSEPIRDKKTGLEVIVLGKSNREFSNSWWSDIVRIDKCDYLRLNFRGHSFFIKRSFITENPGFNEFKNTVSAEKALKDLDFIKVVKPKLGFQDKNQSWYVSEWQELESVGFAPYEQMTASGIDDYGNQVDNLYRKGEETKKRIDEKVEEIRTALKRVCVGIPDLEPNLFYNPNTETFILLDVTSENSATLGKPIRDEFWERKEGK